MPNQGTATTTDADRAMTAITGLSPDQARSLLTLPEGHMLLADGYARARKGAPELTEYRPMTASEAKALSYGDHPHIRANDGTARVVKVNGQPRTWKRDPARVEVPVKYGLRECATLRARPDGTMESLIVRV